MPEPLQILGNLRVRDCDAAQYVVEQRSEKGNWNVVAFVGKVENLPEIVRRHVIKVAVVKAERDAVKWFGASGLPSALLALPPKTGKKESDNA